MFGLCVPLAVGSQDIRHVYKYEYTKPRHVYKYEYTCIILTNAETL